MLEERKRPSKLPFFEMMLLCIGSGLFFFSLYLLPRLVFGMQYDVPQFVIWLEEWCLQHENRSPFLLIFLPIFGLSGLTLYLAHWINQIIEEETAHSHRESTIEQFLNQPRSLLKLLSMFLLTIAVLFGFIELADHLIERMLP